MAVVACEWLFSGLAKVTAGTEYLEGFRDEVLGMASMMSPPWYERLLERWALGGAAPLVAGLALSAELAIGASFAVLAAWAALRPLPRPALLLGTAASGLGAAYAAVLAAYMGDVVIPGKANPFYEGVGLDLLLALAHAVFLGLFLSGLALTHRPSGGRPRAALPWLATATALQCVLAYEWLDSAAAKLAHYPFFASHFAEWVTDHTAILSPAWYAALVRATAGAGSPLWPAVLTAFEAALGLALLASAAGLPRDAGRRARLGLLASAFAIAYSAALILYQGEAVLPWGAEPFDEAVGLDVLLLLLQAALAVFHATPGAADAPQISSTIGRIIGRLFVFSKRKWASASRTRLLIVDHSVTGVPLRPVSACMTRWRASSRSFSDSRT